jgi:mRNA interferase HigB
MSGEGKLRRSYQHVKRDIRSASILKDGRVVFNLAGIVYIRFIGTHRQYDSIDAQKV